MNPPTPSVEPRCPTCGSDANWIDGQADDNERERYKRDWGPGSWLQEKYGRELASQRAYGSISRDGELLPQYEYEPFRAALAEALGVTNDDRHWTFLVEQVWALRQKVAGYEQVVKGWIEDEHPAPTRPHTRRPREGRRDERTSEVP